MLEQLRTMLDAAKYRESQLEQFGPEYHKWLMAAQLRSALERAVESAEVIEANP